VRAIDIIRKKRDGEELTPEEIDFFVRGSHSDAEWAPYQLSVLLMAVFLRGMTTREIAHLTRDGRFRQEARSFRYSRPKGR